jgi:uncharacterized damage-inducible protein DinB
MAKPLPVTPTYASGDLGLILELEQRQIIETVEDLTEEQLNWRPNEKAKSALDILWHLAYRVSPEKPATKADALDALQEDYVQLLGEIAAPGKLDEPVTWWTGDTFPYRGMIWGQIRHRSYHLGELVYLRQTMGLDEPQYYHE